jgi:hypothetical protein
LNCPMTTFLLRDAGYLSIYFAELFKLARL